MTTIQVRTPWFIDHQTIALTFEVIQDVFVIPDGAPGALAELERRKFTAEEGVSVLLRSLITFSSHVH